MGDEIKKRVNERANALKMKLNKISSKQANALQNEMNHLTEYQDAIKQAMNKQNVLSFDPNLDSTKRQSKILQIADNVLIGDKKRDNVELNDIVFAVDPNEDAMYKNIEKIGNVCLQSNAPIIAVSDIMNNTAKITLHSSTKQTCIQCQIRYKEFDKNDDDEKKKKKKKKK